MLFHRPDITTLRICSDKQTATQRVRGEGRVREEMWEEGAALYWEGVEQGWDEERETERER